ncbi:MAG: group II intron reverse transcriptase/maturase [Planctomycetaceae bacterium]|nr:group II intron reverse transcriptase/maturase [Planctomycetaceae bacterium]
MTKSTEEQPVAVPETAKRAGETLRRWCWVEPTIWTERMLTALDEGVKGGRWFSLSDKVHTERTLRAAFRQVASNRGTAGVDRVTIAMFEGRLDENLENLSHELRKGTYRPQAIRRHYIPKPGSQETRPLGIPTVRDRVVQTALRMVLEPIFERDFAEHSYGFRPHRGCKDALRRVEELLKAGYTTVVDADLKSYFDTIPHDRLLALVRQQVSDGRILALIEGFLKQGVLDGLREWTPARGSPQGAVVSPLLSNIYLNPLDHVMAHHGFEMVRYADDFVILCRSPEEAARALETVQHWTAEAGLTLHPTKTRIVDATSDGFDFLGYRFEGGTRRPRTKSLDKLKDTIRAKTKRTSGESLRGIIDDVNRTLRGGFEYFKHSHRGTFPRVDQWIRMRLRSILRRRLGLRGRGRGSDHHRWPNAFFADQGLFSLRAAHALACQSLKR